MSAYSPGFRSLDSEHENLALDVAGEIPAWLSGSLVRNGPGKFEVGGERVEHWFDGLAMLHKFRFEEGRGGVTYSNRFLRTDAYREAVEEGRLTGQFATSGSYLYRLKSFLGDPTDNANVNVARVGGEYVALTETPRRVRFDPETLAAAGDLAYGGDLTVHHVTAHLQRDDRRGESVGYATQFGRTNRYHLYRVPDDPPAAGALPQRIPIASLAVEKPAYLHSFALTPRYAVLIEPPFVTNPMRFLLPGNGGFVDNFRWKPERGTRFLAFERDSGDLAVERRVDPFFFFHTVNAFESGDDLVVDLVAYEDAGIVSNLFMGAVEGEANEGGEPGETSAPDSGPELAAADGELVRFRVPVEGGGGAKISRRTLYAGTELPRTSPAVRSERYRYAYGQATRREGQNGLVKVNVETGEATEWWADGHYAGEPIFVPRPTEGDSGRDSLPEDRGVVLAPALDVERERSLLVVLDGERFEEVARAEVPHHIPFGFHGEFFPEVTT
ncbi:carotenoid oxygenase family protein [Halorussus gelatinilyticus]|uniref:Carotenoid oxygenase family protein n=1 Tax=Halorussus gelatinilyticus TaxID=2937524 RepID=A0A8U0IFP6_9EURY|nr:carotenoid oxygenase family protein [Halorussus gelatinilyticus]UPV99707.1 carotenoid oxygenase family protein [Halorussus gelatinilyticus]